MCHLIWVRMTPIQNRPICIHSRLDVFTHLILCIDKGLLKTLNIMGGQDGPMLKHWLSWNYRLFMLCTFLNIYTVYLFPPEFAISSWLPDCEIDVERCDCLPRPEPTLQPRPVHRCPLNSSICAHKHQRYDPVSCRWAKHGTGDRLSHSLN